jgi:hypothetical protein
VYSKTASNIQKQSEIDINELKSKGKKAEVSLCLTKYHAMETYEGVEV